MIESQLCYVLFFASFALERELDWLQGEELELLESAWDRDLEEWVKWAAKYLSLVE